MSAKFSGVPHMLGALSPHERVFLPGGTVELTSVLEGICQGAAPPLGLVTSYVAGLNPVPFGQLPSGTTFESIFSFPDVVGAQASGLLRHVPQPYGHFIGRITGMSFDTVIVHVSEPDAEGVCSFGPSVELTPLAMARAKRIFAVVNSRLPRMPKSATFRLTNAAGVLEIEAPLRTYDVGAPTAQMSAIAKNVAEFVSDGVTLQIGIGKVPDALLKTVRDRRGLRLHTGMLSDGARTLVEAGALDATYAHVSCMHLGSAAYLEWLKDNAYFEVKGCDFTHAARVLVELDRLVAVNGALSVDLFGQANLEMLGEQAISAVGGAADFSRAAAASPTGISIIALPAVSGRAAVSRIVPKLAGLVAVPRHDIDVVVTEFGAADLRGRTVMERAERIIAIAAPEHRSVLSDAWWEMAARL